MVTRGSLCSMAGVLALLLRHTLRRQLCTGTSVSQGSEQVVSVLDAPVETKLLDVPNGVAGKDGTWGWRWQDQPSNTAAGDTPSESARAAKGLEAVPKWFRGNGDCQLVYAANESFGARVDGVSAYLPGNAESSYAVLSVYDVSKVISEKDSQQVSRMCSRSIDGMWHISLKVFGHTYDNVRMVDGILPDVLSPFMRYQFTLRTQRKPSEWKAFFENVRTEKRFSLEEYDMKLNNCNHFQAEMVTYLAGGAQVDLITAPEVLSPLDFGLEEPPPRLHRLANIIVMRGMQRRQRELLKASAERRHRTSLVIAYFVSALLVAPFIRALLGGEQ